RADALGLRVGARGAAARRALLGTEPTGALAPAATVPGTAAPNLAEELAELVDGRRPAPDPEAVLNPDAGALTAAVGVADVQIDPADPHVLVVTPHSGNPLRIQLQAGVVPSGTVARADAATIVLDHRANPTAAAVALAGAIAEVVSSAAGLPTGPPAVRPGPPTSTPLTVADARSLAEVRAAAAQRRVRGRAVPAAEILEALGRELGLLGTGDGAVVRRGLVDPDTERALAALGDAEPEALTRARQQVEAVAARYVVGGETARGTRLDANQIRLEVGSTSVALTVRIGGGSGLHPGPVLTVHPAADPLALDRLIARAVATELATRAGLPANVTSDDVADTAELSVLAQHAADRSIGRRQRRAAARAVVTLRAAADLDPARPGGERRYERLRAAGLIDPDSHTALAALLDADAMATRRATRDALVTAAEQAGATAVTPVGDGVAVVTLPDGTHVTLEVADGDHDPTIRVDGGDVVTVLRPDAIRPLPVAVTPATLAPTGLISVDHSGTDLVALAGQVAAELARRQGRRANDPVLRPGPVDWPLAAHGVTDVAGLARLRTALTAAPAEVPGIIAELGLAHDTVGAAERRATLPADLRADVARLDGAAGSAPAVRTGLATVLATLTTSGDGAGVRIDDTRPNVLRVRFADPAGSGTDLEVDIAVYRSTDPGADLVTFDDDATRGLTVIVNENASEALLEHALTVALTRWTRLQLTPAAPAAWGPGRLTLPLDPQRWTPAHYAAVASLRVLLRQLPAARTAVGRTLLRDAVLRSRIRQLSGQLGLDRGVGRVVSRLDLLVSTGQLSAADALAMLEVDRPSRVQPIRRADDRHRQDAVDAARRAIEELAGEHGIAEIRWQPVSWSTDLGTYHVRLDNGRSFELEVVAGTLVASEAADGPIDPTHRLASVVVNQRRPTFVSRVEWRRRMEREAVAQTVALATRQPPPGRSAASTRAVTPTNRVFRRGIAALAPLTPEDHVALARLDRWVRQYGGVRAASLDETRSPAARAGARLSGARMARRLNEQLTLLGLDAGAPGVHLLRAHLPDDVRAILERHDGGRAGAAPEAVVDRARAALDRAARLGGLTVSQPSPGQYQLHDPSTRTTIRVRFVASDAHRDDTAAGYGRGVVVVPPSGAGPVVLALSPWLDDGQVDQVVARAIGELTAASPDVATDRGRVLEVAALVDRIGQARSPISRARLRRQLADVAHRLGLDRDAPGVANRRALFGGRPEVLTELRRADELGRRSTVDLPAVSAELARLAAHAGVAGVAPDAADPHRVDVTLADGTVHSLLIVPDQAGEGSLADGYVDPVVGPVLRLDTRAEGLARQAALVRELARVAAQLDRLSRGLPADPAPVPRPGPRTTPLAPADLAPDDWALAAEG
ncbi:hypothetical protein, partial [Cryptosporangium minutisporangium]|uniref:hypothetical protein n=1 Tax=Cryptosporangium minutisporangium TaxID=113569 RepID=UPI0035E49E1C